MLELAHLHAGYGPVRALEDVSLTVETGQVVCLLGANGAGKTTTLNCISGLVAASDGTIAFDGADITQARVEDIVARGVVQVPEGREIFPAMTVEDNLRLGAWLTRDGRRIARNLAHVYELFPRLKERAKQHAGTLSGGEQQMLMIGRALMAEPKLLMLDEPSLGLSPILVEQVFATVKRIHGEGLTILLVEQNASVALDAATYGYILENGEIIHHGRAADLRASPQVREAYLGGR
ncbi:MAG TPA: ABC transporter ATP-binding protein [Xanthobacteraceae bacterium]|nr:ABC transporter ATP-binding protein [Xanthobacteraceae bacterium]